MRALDAYRDVHRELDRTESPAFTRKDFNHFFNSGIDGYVAKNYADYPLIQKSLDDIRAIVKWDQALTFTNFLTDLPADYRHVLSLKVTVKMLATVGRFKKDLTYDIYPEREKSGQEGYNANNAFHRPSIKVPYYALGGDKMKLKLGAYVNVEAAALDYIKKPAKMFLSPIDGADLTLEANNTTFEFPDHVYYEVIKETVRIVLEWMESQRYSSTMQEQQMRPN